MLLLRLLRLRPLPKSPFFFLASFLDRCGIGVILTIIVPRGSDSDGSGRLFAYSPIRLFAYSPGLSRGVAVWLIAALLFTAAVVGKVALGGFDDYLLSTGMFPAALVSPLAWGVMGLEVLTSVLLLWPRTRRAAWLLVGALSAAFAVSHVAGAVLGDVKPCRCLAVQLSHDAWWNHVGMAGICVGLVIMAFLGVRAQHAEKAVVPEGAV